MEGAKSLGKYNLKAKLRVLKTVIKPAYFSEIFFFFDCIINVIISQTFEKIHLSANKLHKDHFSTVTAALQACGTAITPHKTSMPNGTKARKEQQ